MPGRDDPGVGGARVPPDTLLLLEERHLVAVLGEEVRGRDAGDAPSEHQNSHGRENTAGPDSPARQKPGEGAGAGGSEASDRAGSAGPAASTRPGPRAPGMAQANAARRRVSSAFGGA